MPKRRPSVGRGAELEAIGALLDSLATGSGGTLLLVGEPGAGKSHLCEQAVTWASERGFDHASAACQPFELDRPLAPLLDLLGVDALTVLRAGPRTMMEAGAPLHPDLDAAERVIELVERRVAARPLLLVLDDLQWADPGTVRCARLLVERASADGFALLAASRPALDTGPLLALRDDVANGRFPRAGLVELGPLSDREVDELIATLDVTIESSRAADVAETVRLAGGNPLLVMSALRAVGGGPGAEHGSVDPIGRELNALPPEVLALAQIASLLRRDVDVELLGAVASRSPLEVLPDLATLVARGIMVDDDVLRFRHDVYRQAASDTMPASARAALHLQIAELLMTRNGDEVEICEHLLLGAPVGDRRAVQWLRDCAVRLVRQSPGQALRLIDAAIALDRSGEIELQFTRFEALSGVGRSAEAEELGRSLLHEARGPVERARLYRELALTDFVQGKAGAACADMAEAVALLEGSEHQPKAIAELAFATLLALDVDGARSLAARAVDRGTDADTLTAAHCALLLAALFHGDITEAHAQSDLLLQHAERPTTVEAHQYQPWFCAGLLAAETDDLVGVTRLARRGREVAVAAGSSWAVPAYDALSAFAALRSGHLSDAEAHARAALDYSEEVDSFGIVVWCHAFLAQVALARGDVALSRFHLDAAEGILATGRSGFGLDHVAHTRATLHVVDGDLESGHAVLRGTWDAFTATSLDLPRQWMGPSLARLCAQTGRTDEAMQVAEQLEQAAQHPHLVVAQADALVARSWATGEPAFAREAVEALRSTPRALQRADALVAAAVLTARAGADHEVPALATEAVSTYESIGATAWADAAAGLVPRRRSTTRAVRGLEALTKSERSVLDLVAEGLTNTQIADRLHLSRRTVESHVSAAYRKLEVSTRVELANALRSEMGHPPSSPA